MYHTRTAPALVSGLLAALLIPATAGAGSPSSASPDPRAISGDDTTAASLAENATPNSGTGTQATALPEMTVMGSSQAESSYSVFNATAATKTDTPILETPVSIQVIPRAVIEDQKVTRLQEALENVSGVRPQGSLGTGGNFIIRGFSTGFRSYRNGLGLIDAFGGSDEEFDTANLETIEVLKGPAAVLFGRIEPGGLINVTTKRPLGTPYYSLEQRFGSYDFFRTEWDATGPITSDQSLLYRFTGGYQNNESFRDFVSDDRVVVNPSLTWRPTEATSFTLDVEGLNKEFKADFGLPVIGRRPAPIPISRSFDDPNTPLAHKSHVLVGTELIHHFNDAWSLHNRFLATLQDSDSTFVNPVPFGAGNPLRADNRTLDRNIFFGQFSTEAYTTNLDMTS